MDASRIPSLEEYDESTDEHRVAEYYIINPEERYDSVFNDDFFETDSEIPDSCLAGPIQSSVETIPFRAVVDQCGEISELITDIKNSKYIKFEVCVQENCYESFIQTLRHKIPDIRINFTKVENGYHVFKMDF